jgi:hypothetical protein
MVILPELPKLETPVRRLTDPDTPDDPEFAEDSVISPVEEGDSPEVSVASPPLSMFPKPLDIRTFPTLDDAVCPTDKLISPALPLAFPSPLTIPMRPEEPELDEPEAKNRLPLLPAVPAFWLAIETDPLEVPEPIPATNNKLPPLELEEIEATPLTEPPTPPLPDAVPE